MADPWERPPFPSRGNTSQRVLFESIGRALMAWEEIETSFAHLYSSLARGSRFHLDANREYGALDNFMQRVSGLEAQACRYFVHGPCQEFEGRFADVTRLARAYAPRRNDIAHGVARHIHWILNPNSRESLLGLAPNLQWCLVPPHFRENKFTPENRPTYVLTSHEMNEFSKAFWDIARHVSTLADDLERSQQAALAALLQIPTARPTLLSKGQSQ